MQLIVTFIIVYYFDLCLMFVVNHNLFSYNFKSFMSVYYSVSLQNKCMSLFMYYHGMLFTYSSHVIFWLFSGSPNTSTGEMLMSLVLLWSVFGGACVMLVFKEGHV